MTRCLRCVVVLAAVFVLLPVSTPTRAQEPKDPWVAEVGEPTLIKLYFIRNGQLAVVHRVIPMPEGKEIARATTRNLLAGPTTEEQALGVDTAIPRGTDLIDIQLDGETETLTVTLGINFLSQGYSVYADEMALRYAQVVYTLTQFRNVTGAIVLAEANDEGIFVNDWGVASLGRRFDRAQLDYNRGPVFFDSPAIGDEIGSPLRLTGVADRYLDGFTVAVYDLAGNELGAGEVFTRNGRTQDSFDVELDLDLGAAESDLVVLAVTDLDPRGDDRHSSFLLTVPLWLA